MTTLDKPEKTNKKINCEKSDCKDTFRGKLPR